MALNYRTAIAFLLEIIGSPLMIRMETASAADMV
jgi:hypothetical protein